jgi:hypothetical protein
MGIRSSTYGQMSYLSWLYPPTYNGAGIIRISLMKMMTEALISSTVIGSTCPV